MGSDHDLEVADSNRASATAEIDIPDEGVSVFSGVPQQGRDA